MNREDACSTLILEGILRKSSTLGPAPVRLYISSLLPPPELSLPARMVSLFVTFH